MAEIKISEFETTTDISEAYIPVAKTGDNYKVLLSGVIPVSTSDLDNDSGFITAAVSDLASYYLKSETYTRAEVQSLISQMTTINFEVVSALPTTGQPNIIYLVPKPGDDTDVHDEYIWVDNKWELIGNTQADLTNYYTKTEVDDKLALIGPYLSLYGGIMEGPINAQQIIPDSNRTYTLGSSIMQWARVYSVTFLEDGTPLQEKYQAIGSYASSQELNDGLAAKQDTLIAGNNITIGPDGKTISAPDPGSISSRIVNISDFETFNPSSSLVDSLTGSTFTLNAGESCGFYADYAANGKPSMGSGSNPISSIYYWSGTITRISGSYYMVTAYGSNPATGRPQTATRVYYGSSRYDWIVGTDYSVRSTSGYVKLPSGIMIQWGRNANTAATRTTVFPLTFVEIFNIATTMWGTSNGANVATGRIVSYTASDFVARCMYVSWNSDGGTTDNMDWLAIGTWK